MQIPEDTKLVWAQRLLKTAGRCKSKVCSNDALKIPRSYQCYYSQDMFAYVAESSLACTIS